MSKLNELLNKLCPNGVQHLSLIEVCRFQNGFSFSSSLFKQTGLPVLRITNIDDGQIIDDGLTYFDKEDYDVDFSQFEVGPDSIVVAMSGATTGKIGFNYSKQTYYLNQRVGMFVPNERKIRRRYLYHYLRMLESYILSISSGTGAQPNLSSKKMMETVIPVPPLEVQDEIVRILDNFTELTAELTAELQDRKKQYEYYRDSLLTFNSNYEYKKDAAYNKVAYKVYEVK